MRALRLIRAIATLTRVTRPSKRDVDGAPIDPSLMPVDLAAHGMSGLRLG